MVKEIRSAAEIKKQNIASIKRVILEMGSVTKPEVAAKTGLSVVTCGSILNELTASGIIIEESLRLSSGGRPAMSYRFSEGAGNTLCLYTYTESTGSFIRYQIFDINGNIKDSGFSQEEKINISILADRIKKISDPNLGIKVIVLGVQGCINNNILEYSDLTELTGINIAQELEASTGIPTRVENDMNTVALGYKKLREKNNDNTPENNVAMLFFPKGQTPAGGFIVDGHILRGSSNLAGELSFYPYCFDKTNQRSAFSDISVAAPIINQLIIATTIFLDPAIIVVTGGLSNEMTKEYILKYLQDNLKRSQLPKIEIRPMVETEYFAGLYSIALDFLIDG